MSERWRNSAKTALGVGGCGDQLPRASRWGEHAQALTARTCGHLCRSGDRSGSGSHQPQAAAARVTAGMIATRESTSDGSNVASGDGGVSTGVGFERQCAGDLAGLLQIRLHTGSDPAHARGCIGWWQADRAAGGPQAAQPPGVVRAARHRAAGGRPPRPRADLHGDRQEVRCGTEHGRQVHPAGQAQASRGAHVASAPTGFPGHSQSTHGSLSHDTRQHLHVLATGSPSIGTERARRAALGQTALHADRDHQARKNHRSRRLATAPQRRTCCQYYELITSAVTTRAPRDNRPWC